jgi:hypothetical protein
VLNAPSYAPKHKHKYPRRGQRGCPKQLRMLPTENTLPKKLKEIINIDG